MHDQLEGRLPTSVLEVVVVEVDGCVLLGCGRPAHLLASPGVVRHRPRRQIDRNPVQPTRRQIVDRIRADADREIPCCEHTGGERFVGSLQALYVRCVERAVEQLGTVDLAVEHRPRSLVGVEVPRRQQQVTGRQLHPPAGGQLLVMARHVRRAVWLG